MEYREVVRIAKNYRVNAEELYKQVNELERRFHGISLRLWHHDDLLYWRKFIYKRDNYTCQRCGEHGGYLNSHHILNFWLYPELRFEISNGITFCKKCHDIFHNIYGKRNNTKEQVEVFINGLKMTLRRY